MGDPERVEEPGQTDSLPFGQVLLVQCRETSFLAMRSYQDLTVLVTEKKHEQSSAITVQNHPHKDTQRCRQVCMKVYILLLLVPAGAASQHCAWPHHSRPVTPKARQGEGSSQDQLSRGSFFFFFYLKLY